MNKNLVKSIGLLACAHILSYTVSAQRTVDIETILKNPAEGQEIIRGQEFTISVELKNNGPDDLVTGDTLAILISGNAIPFTLLGDIAEGETVLVFETGATFAANADNNTITDIFCAEILDINSSGASMGGQPLIVSYDDPEPVNNQACHEIAIAPANGGTSIQQEQVQATELTAFPNPANKEVVLQVGHDLMGIVTVRIIDLNGRQVMEQAYTADQVKKGSLSVNVGQLPAGMFMVNVLSDTKTVSGKLIIAR